MRNSMFARELDAKLQLSAALALLEGSRLLEWDRGVATFTPVPHVAFEYSWRKDVHPTFGRLMCWMNFSAGAELFAKGVCLAHGFEIRKPQHVVCFPQELNFDEWATAFRNSPAQLETIEVTHFGTLGYLLSTGKGGGTSVLERLCHRANATSLERNLVLASYELLRSTIRNRDAHAYVPNVRDQHFFLVPKLFASCFNILASWLPGGPQVLNQWNDEIKLLVQSL